MQTLLLIAVPFIAIALLIAVARVSRTRRHAGSATVGLEVDGDRISRRMADGREESVSVSRLSSVEVVCTRVRTADGAEAFALLGETEERGCLLPLGTDLDGDAVVALSTLPGFDLATFSEAASHRGPCRTVVWTRGTQPNGNPASR